MGTEPKVNSADPWH